MSTLRERLGLPTPPPKAEPKRDTRPEWIRRAAEHRLPVRVSAA